MKKNKVKVLTLCAMFAALTAVLSQLAIPLWPVPVNMALLSVFMAGGLLGAKYGTLSQIVYVLLGAFGAPVFSGFSGGVGIVSGVTGGFIIGYIAAAFTIGLIVNKFGRKMKILIPAMICGTIVTYSLGISWYMYLTKVPFIESFTVCVLPFLPGDAVKCYLSSLLVRKLYASTSLGQALS